MAGAHPVSDSEGGGPLTRTGSGGRSALFSALGRGQEPPPGDESPHVELSDAPGQLRSAAEQAAQAWGDNSSLSLILPSPCRHSRGHGS